MVERWLSPRAGTAIFVALLLLSPILYEAVAAQGW